MATPPAGGFLALTRWQRLVWLGRPSAWFAAYRIAQQAIDNALVHGHPTRIELAIAIAGDRLALQVSDDGTGISADAERGALRAGRLGLADMRARAAAISGSFRVWRRPEGGTTVELRWSA